MTDNYHYQPVTFLFIENVSQHQILSNKSNTEFEIGSGNLSLVDWSMSQLWRPTCERVGTFEKYVGIVRLRAECQVFSDSIMETWFQSGSNVNAAAVFWQTLHFKLHQ